MALPPALIQIKGRRGYYVNIPVPRALQREIKNALKSGLALSKQAQRLEKKGTIQKKAADTVEEARKVLAREQVAAQALFDAIEEEVRTAGRKEPEELRAKYWAWKNWRKRIKIPSIKMMVCYLLTNLWNKRYTSASILSSIQESRH